MAHIQINEDNFNAEEIAKQAYNAMKGWGTDEEALRKALIGLTPEQANEVKQVYADLYGKGKENALEKAIKWNAKVILSVPCCQHEVHQTMKCSNLTLFEDYGLIQERLSSLITDVTRAEVLKLNGYNFSILIVDDNSKDSTAQIVKNLQKDYLNLYILERGGKFGLASAYIDGFKYGADLGYKAFVQMAADFSHNPEYLPDIQIRYYGNERNFLNCK